MWGLSEQRKDGGGELDHHFSNEVQVKNGEPKRLGSNQASSGRKYQTQSDPQIQFKKAGVLGKSRGGWHLSHLQPTKRRKVSSCWLRPRDPLPPSTPQPPQQAQRRSHASEHVKAARAPCTRARTRPAHPTPRPPTLTLHPVNTSKLPHPPPPTARRRHPPSSRARSLLATNACTHSPYSLVS